MVGCYDSDTGRDSQGLQHTHTQPWEKLGAQDVTVLGNTPQSRPPVLRAQQGKPRLSQDTACPPPLQPGDTSTTTACQGCHLLASQGQPSTHHHRLPALQPSPFAAPRKPSQEDVLKTPPWRASWVGNHGALPGPTTPSHSQAPAPVPQRQPIHYAVPAAL